MDIYKIPKIPAEEWCRRVQNLTRQHSQETIEAMKMLNDAGNRKTRFANARAQMGRIEAAIQANPSYDPKKDTSVTGFGWPLGQRFLTPAPIDFPMKAAMKDKLASAEKATRESLNYELQYYRRYYKRRRSEEEEVDVEEVKYSGIVDASINSFRKKVTVCDKNFDFASFENKCKIIAGNPDPKAELCFYE